MSIKRGVLNFLSGSNATTPATNETILDSTTIALGENASTTVADKVEPTKVDNDMTKLTTKPLGEMSIQKEIKKRNNAVNKKAPSVVESRKYVDWFQERLDNFEDSFETGNDERGLSDSSPMKNSTESEESTTIKQNSTQDGTTVTPTTTTTTNLNQANATNSTEAPNDQESDWTKKLKVRRKMAPMYKIIKLRTFSL